ncbi:MAG: DUF1905 domain-containing protein [Chitinophagaceae bacterium]|nr:DUF1905 domain-containing protein [Chitinophagaceae bacterium]
MKPQVTFSAVLQRFQQMGEKTGWTYIVVPEEMSLQLHSADRKGYRVKGLLNEVPIAQVALMPMGEGEMILPVNANMRKQLQQPVGATIQVRLSKDDTELSIAADLLACLEDEPEAMAFFQSLAASHRKYFSKWIDDAKTDATRTKRLVQAVEGLKRKLDYGTMIRWGREQKL